MRVIAVSGVHRSGKTTTIEQLIRELSRRGHSVGTVKDIHRESFSMDRPGSNTDRHRAAGAEMVTAVGPRETDILIRRRLGYDEVLAYYTSDFVILEGAHDFPVPRVVCARSEAEIGERLDAHTFCISGPIAASTDSYRGLPAVDAMSAPGRLADLVTIHALEWTAQPARARSSLEAEVSVDGEDLPMVPFVQEFVASTILGMLSALKGFTPGREVQVTVRREPQRA
ncbi:MAG: molybdopterin-guanine dinucleotide biosynthesis protein MobB [Firmicutes bacterium]|nr:molybdopterin-guanine dinucleotide biosynthesis protein MobB [Bacillota bacterium]